MRAGIVASTVPPPPPLFYDDFNYLAELSDHGYTERWSGDKTRGGTANMGVVNYQNSLGGAGSVRHDIHAGDVDVLVGFSGLSSIRRGYGLWARVQDGWDLAGSTDWVGAACSTSGYSVEVSNDSNSTVRRNGIQVASFSRWSLNSHAVMRLRVVGGHLQFRHWLVTEPEPVDEWTLEWTDPDPLPGGSPGFAFRSGTARSAQMLAPFIVQEV